MNPSASVVLSALEFDVLWESQRFSRRHVVLDVPSPGTTHTERAALVASAWDGLAHRGLASRGRADPDLADQLALLAAPQRSVDVWVWADREIRALAATSGRQAVLAVIDQGEVWLIPARHTSFVEAAVSVIGTCPVGRGRSVSVPLDALRAADADADGDVRALADGLTEHGVGPDAAHDLAAMFTGIIARGQFGAERMTRDGRIQRASRVVAFHDTHRGRYLYLAAPSADGRQWATVTPVDSDRLIASVSELVDELSARPPGNPLRPSTSGHAP